MRILSDLGTFWSKMAFFGVCAVAGANMSSDSHFAFAIKRSVKTSVRRSAKMGRAKTRNFEQIVGGKCHKKAIWGRLVAPSVCLKKPIPTRVFEARLAGLCVVVQNRVPGALEKSLRTRNATKQGVCRAPKMVEKHYKRGISPFCRLRPFING